MRKYIILLLLTLGCSCVESFSTSTSALEGDQRLEIQALIDANDYVVLPPGEYLISNTPSPGPTTYQSLTLRDGQSLCGSGPGTVLKFFGDVAQNNWRGIRMVSGNSHLCNLTVDTSMLLGTQEQTHAVEVLGNATFGSAVATITNVWFKHPSRGMPGGDCVRLLGEEATPVAATITSSQFLDCDRSGVAIQRATYGLVIANNVFHWTGDQDIDGEMTGTSIGGEWAITGNIMRDRQVGGSWRGGISVALSGNISANRITFTGNVLHRSMSMFNPSKAIIANNVIIQNGMGVAVQVIKEAELTFSGNEVYQNGGTHAAMTITHQGSGNPGALMITGNKFLSNAASQSVVNIQNATSVTFANNRLEGGVLGVNVAGTTRPTEAVVFAGNILKGAYANAMALVNVERASVVGNIAQGAVSGLRCTAPMGTVVSAGNIWATNNCPMLTPGL